MAPVPQNPSPMVEFTRAHERVQDRVFTGQSHWLEGGALTRPVEIYVPRSINRDFDILIHFHGVANTAKHAVESVNRELVLAVVNMGTGSSVYEEPFARPEVWAGLKAVIRERVGTWRRMWLSGFSAGYGALRAVLATGEDEPDGVLVLDGLHTGYTPIGRPLAVGGVLEKGGMSPFIDYAKRAAVGERAMLITHSEVFPGTFASTTETADALLGELQIERRAVLEWGPLGMQQLSRVQVERLSVMGYAGNSSPDHMDHLHGLSYFLDCLIKM
jgi:hypothetical protein